jgi:hypothetical protein
MEQDKLVTLLNERFPNRDNDFLAKSIKRALLDTESQLHYLVLLAMRDLIEQSDCERDTGLPFLVAIEVIRNTKRKGKNPRVFNEQLFEMRYNKNGTQQKTHQEISEITELHIQTVKYRLAKIAQLLKNYQAIHRIDVYT